MLKYIVRYIKKFSLCGFCQESFSFEKDYIISNENCTCEQKVLYKDIKFIVYTIIGNYCYWYILQKSEEECSSYDRIFMQGVQMRITSSHTREYLEMAQAKNISVIPAINVCNIPMIDNADYSLFQYAFLNKKAILSILSVNKQLLVSEPFSNVHKEIDYEMIFHLLKDYREILKETTSKETTSKEKKNRNFSIIILDKLFTLNRGYGLYPVLNNEIIIEDIFYSFSQEEIKSKVIELFDKYNV